MQKNNKRKFNFFHLMLNLILLFNFFYRFMLYYCWLLFFFLLFFLIIKFLFCNFFCVIKRCGGRLEWWNSSKFFFCIKRANKAIMCLCFGNLINSDFTVVGLNNWVWKKVLKVKWCVCSTKMSFSEIFIHSLGISLIDNLWFLFFL